MTLIISDTFTAASGTAVTATTADVGGTWIQQGVATSNTALETPVITPAGRLRSGAVSVSGKYNLSLVYNTAVPNVADMDVEADVTFLSLLDVLVLTVRESPTDASRYGLQINFFGGGHFLNLVKIDPSGTQTAVTSGFNFVPTVGATHHLKLSVRTVSGNAQLSTYLDGTLVDSATDSSAPLLGIGRAGLNWFCDMGHAYTDTTGLHVDNFTVTDTYVAPTGPSAPTITLQQLSGGDVVTLPFAATAGTNAIGSYALYAGSSAGAEGGTAVATITPTSFPASFPSQTLAAAGAAKYYTVKAVDTTSLSSVASNEVKAARSALVASGTTQPQAYRAAYGVPGLTLGGTAYDQTGAFLFRVTGPASGTPSGTYQLTANVDTAYSGVFEWDAPPGGASQVEDLCGAALTAVAAMKADPLLAKTFNRAQQKYHYDETTKIMTLLYDDGTTEGTDTLSIDNATGTITAKQ